MPPELSLNEVESLARLAARGAGLAWGLADDAGRSARFLASHGADWADSLLTLLDAPPPPDADPLRLGCYLADSAAGAEAVVVPAVAIAAVAEPAWLLPPLVLSGAGFALTLGDIRIAGTTASHPWADVLALRSAALHARFGPAATLPYAWERAPGRARLAPEPAMRLQAYAARIHVPASARSRALGAGGQRLDDD